MNDLPIPYNFFLRAKEEVNHSELKKHGSNGRKNIQSSEHLSYISDTSKQTNSIHKVYSIYRGVYAGVNSVHKTIMNALYHLQFTLYNQVKIQMI